ncbi:hypothetical protein AMS68_000384 [Peltaster fructicola]|uniref:MHD domain-containing protein n=1 Tax=Peltaster fructicola TaxID=286661 RepID=A0A6H0XJG3_9PEZI|nr:hypothetical protein AMS68_000384 [Peltaster fructicola]
MALQHLTTVIRPCASSPIASEWILAACKRQQSTFRRTRKAFKIKPDPSFAPTKTEARDHIIFNPPSSLPNVYHTPSKFLPPNDPRRAAHAFASTTNLASGTSTATQTTIAVEPKRNVRLPKALHVSTKAYNVTPEQVEEIRKLRTEDPIYWTRVRLAEKFNCSSFFIGLCAKSKIAGERQAASLEAIKARWGRKRTEAREERAERGKLWEYTSSMAAIEALYIFDEHNNLIVSHKYISTATPASIILALYLAHPAPRPSLLYLPTLSPPSIVHSTVQDNLLFLSPSSQDTEPLAVLEFLHRVADALEEFVGSPLLAAKITANYDIVAQVVGEIADGGMPCQSEANALRDVVETGPGVLNNLLGNLGIQGSAPSLSSGPSMLQHPQLQSLSSQGSAVPWRRSNVRHTSNEMYVDIVEEINAILAPSGRPLSGFANGSIAFTSKVSGVPDLLLTLSTGGKGAGMGNRGQQLRTVMEHVVFHPCVRLSRWKSEGVMSFVPPDGRFMLCGYEVDLLGPDIPLTTSKPARQLNLPVNVEITTSLGQSGNEFEVRVLAPSLSGKSAAQASLQSHMGSRPGNFRTGSSGDSKSPAVDKLAVRVPIPARVRNVSELRASTGEAHWSPVEGYVEWRLTSKDIGPSATLRCTLQGPLSDEDDAGNGTVLNSMTSTQYEYDEDESYQTSAQDVKSPVTEPQIPRAERYRMLMPTAALLSFSTKGWLASGLKVESLLLDHKSSRGVGADVKPYKGVKYLTVSRDGVEARC